MSAGASSILPKPVRRKRASFVLTSLIDVIFLLVIFFMVTSQIVPFSLIPLAPVVAEEMPGEPANAVQNPPIAIRILSGRVSIGGSAFAMADLGAALAGLEKDGVTGVILIPGAGSTVQDLVSVLEASKGVFAQVTIVNRRGP